MKALLLALCVAGLLAMAGCNDTADIDTGMAEGGDNGGDMNGGNDNGGDNNAIDLQKFVVNNCNKAPSGDPTDINGSSFPPNSQTDPTQSVFTKNCLLNN